MTWDGKDERRRNVNDHDAITRLLILLEQHVKNFDNQLDAFNQHVADDNRNFATLNRAMWVAIGVVTTIQFLLLKFLK